MVEFIEGLPAPRVDLARASRLDEGFRRVHDVQQAIDVLVRDRTAIVITHRLSTIVGADRILIIDGGRLVQQGRHEDLPCTEGRYRAMWMAQRRVSAYPSRLGAGGV